MDDTRFLRRAWLSLLLLMPLPLLVEYSGADVWLENYYFDAATQTFPWRHVWWFNVLMHDGLRSALVFVGVGVAGLLLASMLVPSYLPPLGSPHWRQPRLLVYLLLGLVAGPLLIGLLKHLFLRPCPWDLTMYGGHAPYRFLLTAPFIDWHEAGRCFPAAHASGGFGLLAFVPLLAGRQRALMVGIAMLAGLCLGWTRMMQGAHFLSHNLWSAWVCWATTLVIYSVLRPGVLAESGHTRSDASR